MVGSFDLSDFFEDTDATEFSGEFSKSRKKEFCIQLCVRARKISLKLHYTRKKKCEYKATYIATSCADILSALWKMLRISVFRSRTMSIAMSRLPTSVIAWDKFGTPDVEKDDND